MEHWDSNSNQGSSGSGPTDVVDREATHRNRVTIENFYAALVAGDTSAADTFVSNAITMRPQSNGSGQSALTDYFSNQNMTFETVHHMIADGNFVFAMVEGDRNGSPFGFYDLYRLEDGLIVEYWNSRRAVPNSTASGLPIF